jgi:hypothetical protein
MTSAEHNGELPKHWEVAPANATAAEKLSPELKRDAPTGHADQVVSFDDEWWDKNLAATDKKFKTWLSS